MDHQLFRAKLNRWAYKLVYKPKLYKFDIAKNNPEKARKIRKKMYGILPADDALVCLPKDEVIINQNLSQQNIVMPVEVIDYFIDKSCYRAIMNYCSCRDSNHCKDYPVESGCLFLGAAASRIHPDLHKSVTKEEAKEYIRECRKAGFVQLAGRAKVDTYYLGVGPHEKLFTICNCCPCCCIALAVGHVAPAYTDWFYKMPGVEVSVTDDCIGCGKCIESCIYGGIKMSGDKAFITEQCRACGRCAEKCKLKAIKVNIGKDAVQKTIDFLSSRVDLS